MNFDIETPTTARLTDLEVLSQKDREPGANPGVALHFSALFPNTILTNFDGGLRGTCYAKATGSSKPAQDSLEGVEAITDMPALKNIGERLGQFGWDEELTGYEMVIDYGLGQIAGSNIELEDVKLSGFKITCKEGGTVTVKWKAEVPDVAEKILGKLATLKAQDVKITTAAPEPKQDELPDEKPARSRKAAGQQQPAIH